MPIKIPLPQEQLRPGTTGGFRAHRVAPLQSATGLQVARFGEAVTSAGSAAMDAGRMLQDRTDRGKTTQALNLLGDTIGQVLDNPQTGYMNAVGEAAIGPNRTRAMMAITERAESLSNQLDNDDQRGMFHEKAQVRLTQVRGQVDRYEAHQIVVFDTGQADALRKASIGNAIEARITGDPLDFMRHRKTATDQVAIIAGSLGYPPAKKEALLLETTTAIHSGIVERLVREEQADAARGYLEGVITKEQDTKTQEIDPQEKGRLRGLVRQGAVNERATDLAMDIVERADLEHMHRDAQGNLRPAEAPGGPASAQFVLDRGLKELYLRRREGDITEEVFVATRERLKGFAIEREQSYNAESERFSLEIKNALDRNPGMGLTMLSAADQQKLHERGLWASTARYSEDRGFTEPAAVHDILTMTQEEWRTIPNKEKVWQLFNGEVDEAHMRMAMAAWRDAWGTATGEDTSILANRARLLDTALEHGLITDEIPKGDKAKRLNAVSREVQRRIQREKVLEGVAPKGEAAQKIIDAVFADVVLVGAYSDTEVPRAAMLPGELEDAEKAVGDEELDLQVYDAILTDVKGDFVKKGLTDEVTDADVLKQWIYLGRPKDMEAYHAKAGR